MKYLDQVNPQKLKANCWLSRLESEETEKWLLSEYIASFWGNKHALEVDGGGDCAAYERTKCCWIFHFKMQNALFYELYLNKNFRK